MIHKGYGWMVAIAVAAMINGCGQPAPDGKVTPNNVYDSGGVGKDTVNIDESRYTNGQNGGMSAYNSSADGFQSLYFGFDSYAIGASMQQAIAKNAQVAREYGNRPIRVEGNCDEFGTDEYNYALGLKRAKAVKEALTVEGIDPARIRLISYGESNPACTDQTDACYAQNRRVDLRLIR